MVEGPIDAIKGHRYNAVAILGKSMSSVQFKLLLRMPNLKRIYVALDPDASVQSELLATKLSEIWNVNLVKLPKFKDIGACTQEEVDHYVRISKPYTGREIL